MGRARIPRRALETGDRVAVGSIQGHEHFGRVASLAEGKCVWKRAAVRTRIRPCGWVSASSEESIRKGKGHHVLRLRVLCMHA